MVKKNKRNKQKGTGGVNPSAQLVDRMAQLGIRPVYGQGGYITDLVKATGKNLYGAMRDGIPKGTFERIGRGFGSRYGLGDLGALAGRGIASISGMGAYQVNKNSFIGQGGVMKIPEGVQVPQFEQKDGMVIVTHREFVGDVSASGGTTFTNVSYPIQPGLGASFPWLAGVANNFDSHMILGMVYEFRSTFSDVTAGGALGSVIMATDYDMADSSFTSKGVMENSQYCTSAKPSESFVHVVECAPRQNVLQRLFVRSGAVPSGRDSRLYDLGNFQLATVGLPVSTGVIGELWVTYQVAFFKPTLNNNIAFGNDHFNLPATISASNYLASSSTASTALSSNSTIGGSVTGSTYSFPSSVSFGTYVLMYSVYGASTALTTAIATTLTNCATFSPLNTAGTPRTSAQVTAGATATHQVFVQYIRVSAASATVQISAGTLPGTITGGDFIVQQLPASFN